MALRWLGGCASQRLTGDSLVEALMMPAAVTPSVLLVRRCEVSPHAIMTQAGRDHDATAEAIDTAVADALADSDR
jgi:hypothetical protein